MVNGQIKQLTGVPDLTTAFTAGEGTDDPEAHDVNGNLDTSSNSWSVQGAGERYQDEGNIANSSNNEKPAENANHYAEKNNNIPEEATSIHIQDQPTPHAGNKSQPNTATLVAASINKAAITEEKFGKNGVKEFNKIIHLMTSDPNNGEKLADGYDLARGANITLLSKHGAQSNWTEGGAV